MRMIVLMGVSFYTVRVVLNTLGVEDYGIYNVISGFVAIIMTFDNMLTSATYRFLTFELGKNNIDNLKKTFSTSLTLHIALSGLFLVFTQTIGVWLLCNKIGLKPEQLNVSMWVYEFIILSSIVLTIQEPFKAIIMAHEDMHIFAYFSIIEAVLKLIIVFLLILSPYDKLICYAFLLFLISLIVFGFYSYYSLKHYKEVNLSFKFDKILVKRMMNFSGWNIFGILGTILSDRGTDIILNIFFGPVAVAAKIISLQIKKGIGQLSDGLQSAITPQITKLYAQNQFEELNKLLYQNAKYAVLLVWILVLPAFLQIDYILELWLKNPPLNSALFSKIAMMHALILVLNRPFVSVVHASGNMKETNRSFGVILMLVAPVSYILVKYGFPAQTPLIVYLCASLIGFFIENYYVKKWINTSIFNLIKLVLIPIFYVIFISSFLSYYINNFFANSFLKLVLITALTMIINTILIYFIAFNRDEKSKFKILIKNKIGKLI